MKVRIDITGQNYVGYSEFVMEQVWSRYAVLTVNQHEYAQTFLKMPPPASHLEASEWPEEVAA